MHVHLHIDSLYWLDLGKCIYSVLFALCEKIVSFFSPSS